MSTTIDTNARLIELMKHTGVVDEKTLQEKLKKSYYEGQALITDEEYDKLFPKDYVGYTPEQSGPWEILEHKIPMGSLDKLKTWDQALKWLKDKNVVLWQPKLDGLSLELMYEYGKLKSAVLRGDGDKGENVLKNVLNFIGVPRELPTTDTLQVKGEVVISQSNFNRLLQESNEAYKNRRNCIPGICRRFDGLYSSLLTFYAYTLEDYSTETKTHQLIKLHNYGFKVPFTYNSLDEKQYNSFGDIRDTAEDFQMDGLVLKTNDGLHEIALKFEPKGEISTVTEYTWEVGTTGKLVPKIHFEKVNVGGSNLTQAAVGSYNGYIDLDATVGSKVMVKKMGDVIPKVTEVIERAPYSVLDIPTCCPQCESTLVQEGADLYCKNPQCPVQVKLKCSAVFSSLGIKGVTADFINKLVDAKKLYYNFEVPLITYDMIVDLGGFSDERAMWIVQEMKTRFDDIVKEDKVVNLLWMLPIPTISNAGYDAIAKHFGTIDNFFTHVVNGTEKDFWIAILGNAKGTKAYEYIKENQEHIAQLIRNLTEVPF